ncbi:MAG TPA: glycosyltransferase family 39 protein [Bryobacterales bacterium]|nr:glycosyltransferase family 39 protein [Bryobacterales bacterium]
MSRTAIAALCWAGLVLFTLYLLRVNDSYYRANTRTPTYDEAWYLETSLHLYHRLTRGGLVPFWEAYRGTFGTKAPLIAALPVPFYLVFGVSHYSALLVNSLFIVITNFYLFLLGRRLFSPEVGLAAAVIYQTMPLAYGLSRAVMAEYGLTALVVVWIYYLAASERLSRGPANFALGVTLGLGLLMKIMFPAFVAGPLLVAWFLRQRGAKPSVGGNFWLWRLCARWPAAAIAVPAGIIAGPWYLSNWKTLLAFAWQSAYGQIGAEYAGGGFTQWLLAFVNEGVGAYYTAALLVLGCIALLSGRRWMRGGYRELLLLAWLLPPFIAIAAGSNHLIRFVAPLLPVFAIALAAAVFSLGRSWLLRAGLAVLLVIYPQRLFASLSYFSHGGGHARAISWGPFTLFSRDLGWAHPPAFEEQWRQQQIIEAIRQLDPGAVRPRYVVVGIEHVYLNANLLSYLNAYQEYPLLFTSFGYAESAPDRAVERIFAVDARFLVMGEGFQDLPPFLNRVNGEIQARIHAGELPFRLCATVPLAHRMKALIYEKEVQWTVSPPGSNAAGPARALAADFTGGVRFLGYDCRRRPGGLWDVAYYWSALSHIEQTYRLNAEYRRGGRVFLTEDYPLAAPRHPPAEWQPGEVLRQSFTIYVKPGGAEDLEVDLSLTPWGIGPPQARAGSSEPFLRLRLTE